MFLYGLLDYQVLDSLGYELPLELLYDVLPYSITNELLRTGIPTEQTLQQKLYEYIYYEITYPYFVRNFNDPHYPMDYNTRRAIEQGARDYARNETQLFYNYLTDALGFIEDTGANADVNTSKYVETVNNNPTIPRLTAIRDNVTDGQLPTQNNGRRPRMDMVELVDDAKAYIDKASENESIQYANLLSIYHLGQPAYYGKEWIWSGKKKTRHRGMDGIQVLVDEPFPVVNERTGEACDLMFPRDYARDPTGANTSNCGCDVMYISNRELLKWI